MGTTVHIVLVNGKETMLGDAQQLIENLESKWSRFRTDSEVTKLNRAGGNPCVVSQPTFDLISTAIGAWSASNGAFDPTVEACLRSAGYTDSLADSVVALTPGTEKLDNPRDDNSRVAELSPAPTPRGIWTDRSTRLVQLPVGTTVDLGGIAKGAAADMVAQQLISSGAQGCCVNIGGDIRTLGHAPRGNRWLVSLDVPGQELPTLAFKTGAVCTSTTKLRTWRNQDGSIEHHIRDPRTGQACSLGF